MPSDTSGEKTANVNHVIGESVASTGLVFKGVSALGDAGKALIARGDFNPQAIWRTITGYATMLALCGRPTTKCAGRVIR